MSCAVFEQVLRIFYSDNDKTVYMRKCMLLKVEASNKYLHRYKEEPWNDVPIVSRVLHIPFQYLELPGEEELTQG